jgi:hypothetical protein
MSNTWDQFPVAADTAPTAPKAAAWSEFPVASAATPSPRGSTWDQFPRADGKSEDPFEAFPLAQAHSPAPAYNPRMDEPPAQGSWLGNQLRGRAPLYGGDFGKAINKGHAEEMLSYAGTVPGNEKQTHETIQNIEQAYPTQPGRLDAVGRTVGAMLSQVPQMVLGPKAMAPLGGIAAYGRARAEGSSVPAAAAHGVVGAALGAAQLPVARGIASKLLPRVGNGIAARLAVNTGANYAEQMAAGAAGTVAGNVIDKASIDPNRPLTQGLSNVPYTAIPGALAGGAVMTAHGAAPRPEAPAAEARPPQDQLAGQPDIVAQEAAIDAAEPRLTAQAQADQAAQQQHDAALAAQGRQQQIAAEDRAAMDEENAIVAQRQQDRQHAEQQAAAVAMDFETQIGQMNPRQLYDAVKARGLNPRGREFNTALLLRMGPEQQAPEPVQAPMRGEVRVPQYGSDQLNRLQNPTLRRQADLLDVPYDTRGTTIPRILDAQERRRLGQLTPKQLWDEVRSRGLRAGSKDQNIETLLSAGLEKPVQPQAQAPQPVQRQQQPAQQGTPENGLFGGAQEKSPEPVSTGASTQMGRSSPGVPGRAASEAPEAPFTVTTVPGPVKPEVAAAPAPRPAKTPFTKPAVEKLLLDFHEKMGGGYTRQDEIAMEGDRAGNVQAARSTGDPFTFLGKFPGEVKRYLEQSPTARRQAKKLFKLTDDPKAAGGEDAMHSLGEGGYFDMADKLIGSHVADAKKTARESRDPVMQFWAEVHDNIPPPRERPAQIGVKASKLNVGKEWEMNGAKFQVIENEDGLRILKDGGEYSEVPLDAFGDQKLPVDKNTLHDAPEPEVPDDVFAGIREEPARYAGAEVAPAEGAGRTQPPEQPLKRPRGKRKKPTDSDPAAMSADDFYNAGFYIHSDLRSGSEETRQSILSEGFRRAMNANAVRVSHPNDPSPVARKYAPKAGKDVYLIPPEGIEDGPNGPRVREGWKPTPSQIIRLGEGETLHDAIVRQSKEQPKSFNPPAPAETGGTPQPFTAPEGPKGIFGQETFEPVTGKQAGGLFHEPTKVEAPQRTGKDAKIAQQYDEAATPEMFEKPAVAERKKPTDEEVRAHFAEMDARKQRRVDYVRSQLDENKGGRVEIEHGSLVASKNPGPDRDKYPWRITRFNKDGTPTGHTVHQSFYDPNDSPPYYKSVVGEIAGQIHDPALKPKGPPNAETVRGNPQPIGDEDANGRGAEQRGGDLQRDQAGQAGDRQERGQSPRQEEGQEGPAVVQPKQEGEAVKPFDIANASEHEKAERFGGPIREAIRNAPSFPKLRQAAIAAIKSIHNDPEYVARHTAEYDAEPESLLTAHASVMNAKSARAKTLLELAKKVIAESGVPTNKGYTKFRGDTERIDWDRAASANKQPHEPPVAPGHVRMYHGGKPPGPGESRWLTPDQKYAEGYASKSGVPVSYVDIPKSSPHLTKSFDDTDTGMEAPYNSFNAPPEIAAGLKPVAPAKEQPKGPPNAETVRGNPQPTGDEDANGRGAEQRRGDLQRDQAVQAGDRQERGQGPGQKEGQEGPAVQQPKQEGEAVKPAAKEAASLDESQFVPAKDTHDAMTKPYKAGASSRTTPNPEYPYKAGQWRIDDHFGTRGREIEKLVELDPRTLDLSEDDYTTGKNPEGRGDDARRYAEWIKEGKTAPPASVIETDSGRFRVSDGHRRAAAAKMANKPLLAWVSYRMDTGKRTPEGKPIYQALTYEGAKYGPEKAAQMYEERRQASIRKFEQERDKGQQPPEVLGHGSSPKRPSPGKVKTDLARAVVGTEPTPATDKPAAPAKSEPAVMTAAWDGLRKIFAPQTRTEDAGRAAGYAREHGAELAQRVDRAEADLREARKLFATKTRDENLAFIDKMERGEKQGEGAKEAFAAQIRKLLDERRTEVQKLGKGKLQHFIQDYFPHIWADPEKARQVFAQIAGKRPLEGSKSFLKKRTIPTIDEGIKLGLEPISDNPVDLVLLKLREMDRYIMGQRLLRDLKNAGLVKYVRATEQMPDGYAKIDDKIATVYGPPTVKVPEYVNKSMYDTLSAVAEGLGVTHERKMTLGRSRALGLSYQGASKIETRFGTDLSVMAHEISHQLDDKHDLQGEFLEGRTKKFADELRTLADLHGYKEKYFRKKAEKMATLLEAYVRLGPEEMRRVAPMVSHEFTQYMKQVPALRPLLEYRPMMSEKKLTGEKPHGGLLIMGQYHAPEAVAQVLNNYLSPGLRGHPSFGPMFRAYQGTANVLNQAQLGVSFFHLGFTSMDASISKFAIALERGADAVRLASKAETRAQAPRQLAIAAREAAGTIAAPITNAVQGDKLAKEWMKPGSTGDPEIARLVDAMKAAGGRVRLDPFYRTDHYHKMMEAFRKGNVVAAGLHAVPAGFEKLAAPVMEYVVPRQKLGVFADMARLELEKLTRNNPSPSREQLRAAMGKAWDSVDNRMGQLVYDNLFWKKAAKDLAMASVRSVGWNLGSFREIPGGAIDFAKAGADVARGRPPEFTKRMAYVSSMTVLAGLAGGALHYLMTGEAPDELKDYYFPRTGRTDANSRPIRLSLPTYVKDVVHFTNAPLTTAKNKLHPLIGMVADMLSNEDFYGTEIRNPDDPIVKQALSLASYVGKTALPFSVRGYQNLSEEGVPFAEKAGSFVGVTRAPRDLSLSKAELLAEQLSRAEMPQGSRTSEQAEKSKLKHDLELSLRSKDPQEFRRQAREAMKQGKLQPRDINSIIGDSKLPGLLRRVQNMDATNAAKVYEVATEDERKQIRMAVARKVMNSQTLTNEQKRALLVKSGVIRRPENRPVAAGVQ